MTTTPKLDASGLTCLRAADVQANIVEALRASSLFGPSTQAGADTVLGQLIWPLAYEIGLAYDLLQSIWDAWDLDAAEGVALDNLGSVRGVERHAATSSTVTLTLSGTAGTIITAGKRARVPGGPIFALDADATIGGGGTIDAAATCTETGVLVADAGAITEIVDAVSGWTGVTNAAAATAGSAAWGDPTYRPEIAAGAGDGATYHAMRRAIRALDDVSEAVVIINDGDSADAYGVPAHAYRPVVWPASGIDTDALARAIWDHAPPGIRCDGAETATVTDAEDYQTTVRWSYATQVTMWAELTITKGSDYPSGGDDLVKDAVVAYGAALGMGDDVLIAALEAAAYAACPGVRAISTRLSTDGSVWQTASLDVALDEITAWDKTRVTVL